MFDRHDVRVDCSTMFRVALQRGASRCSELGPHALDVTDGLQRVPSGAVSRWIPGLVAETVL